MKKASRGGLLLKLDFAKAYDNVDWCFLLNTMKEMGFGSKWRLWMEGCISSASLAVLVNGSPTNFFSIEKVLRQGDPLSPLLFNIVVNTLSCMLNLLVDDHSPCGFRVGGNLVLNHLQFADDTLIFCENDAAQLERLYAAIEAFLWASGLKVNFDKSQLFVCNIQPDRVAELATLIEVSSGCLPFQYLGAPLGDNPRHRSFWEPIIEKMRVKLSSWSSKFLSVSGRMVLLKSAIASIPVYYMSVFKAPVGVIGDFEKLMRSFLWGNTQGRRRISWVAWEQICKNQQLGGLGLGFLAWKNKALLLKWAWRFGREKWSLWREVIAIKYGWDVNILALHLLVDGFSNCSPMMQDILRNLLEDSIMAKSFRDLLFCRLGSGTSIRFWLDPWVEAIPLCHMFPRLFALYSNKNVLISEVGCFIGSKWCWSIEFRRQCFGWEVEEKVRLFHIINSLLPSQGEDCLIWLGNNIGIFSVKAIYCLVETKILGADPYIISKKIRKIAPPKVVIFLWQACLNKIAVKDNLMRRGVTVENAGLCSICGTLVETTDHLLIHCAKIWSLWSSIMSREGISWCCHRNLEGLLLEWNSLRQVSDQVLWELIPFSLCWCIWLDRNNLIFQNVNFITENVWDMHISRIAWWIKSWRKDCPYAMTDFLLNFEAISLKSISRSTRTATWFPPPENVLKFNVDGSSLGNPGPSGFGGVLRNSSRQILGVFSASGGTSWAYEAEVKAILNALLFCKQFQFHHVLIESDSALAVGWVSSEQNRPWKLYQDLIQIDRLMIDVNCLGISHIYRKANGLADHLAKSGVRRSCPVWGKF